MGSSRIQQIPVMESHKTLGVYKNICGNNLQHYQYLSAKCQTLAVQVHASEFNRRQARHAYSSSFIPSILYSLPAVDLSKSQLSRLQSTVIVPFLHKCGYDKSFPRSVVYGPSHLGGLGLRHLFSESYTKKIDTVVCHINAKTPLGNLFRINLNWYQQLLGSAQLVLLGIYKRLYVPSNWFTSIGHFFKTISAQIRMQDLWALRLLRQHDRVLMDEVQNFAISLSDQKVFNNWRIYFRVTTLSQVSNAYGNYLLPQLLHPHLISQFNRHRRAY
jgi:hypothetical protein